MRRALLPYMVVALAAASWGTWPIILRKAESIAPTNSALQATFVMATLTVISGVLAIKDRVRVKARWKDWLGIGWLGVGDAANFVLFFAAYKVTSVAVAVLTHYLAPIFVTIAAPFALRERSSARGWGAVSLSFVGLVLLLSPWQAERRAGDWEGAALGASSALFYASNVIVNKRLVGAFSTSELMFYHGLVATPLLAAFVPHAAWSAMDPDAMAILGVGAVGPGALAGLMFVWGLRQIPASHVSTLTLLEPLIAVTLGALLLHESLGVGSIAGGALILLGAGLVVSQSRSETAAKGTADGSSSKLGSTGS